MLPMTAVAATLVLGTPVEEFLGPEASAVLEAPMQATAYELSPAAPGKASNQQGIEAFVRQRALPMDMGATLASLFLTDRTYRFDRRRECDFQPTHALRFEGLSHVVDVLISFRCSQARVILSDREGRMLFQKTEEVDGSKRSLKRLMRRSLQSPSPAAVARTGRVR